MGRKAEPSGPHGLERSGWNAWVAAGVVSAVRGVLEVSGCVVEWLGWWVCVSG